jgi:nucleotidyltransferase/DNA polymerase involved in DNA repair
VEYYSIDEMFFLVPEASIDLAREVQQAILRRVGVPASIGIAATKTLAKLVSDSTKPFGHGVVADEPARLKLLRGLPVTEVTGIAERSRRRLADYGITTCDQFVAADRRLIRRLLTKRGEDLWWELRGEPVLGVATERPQHQNVARGGSLGRATTDPDRLWAFVTRNLERLTEALRHYQLYCDKLILDLSFRPTGRAVRRASLPRSTADFETLLEAGHELLKLAWHGQPVHYMHVIATNLRSHERQQSLWDQPTPQQQVIDQLRHDVNEKVGRFALRSGATAPLADVYADPANAYDICDIHGKSCF